VKDFFTAKEIYYMALENEKYIKDHADFLSKSTLEHLVTRNKIQTQIAAVLQGLKNEQRRLEEYEHEKCDKYYTQVAEDYKAWKRTTGQN
jgi:hypothetical protein